MRLCACVYAWFVVVYMQALCECVCRLYASVYAGFVRVYMQALLPEYQRATVLIIVIIYHGTHVHLYFLIRLVSNKNYYYYVFFFCHLDTCNYMNLLRFVLFYYIFKSFVQWDND